MRLRILLAVVAVLAGALAIAGALSYSLVQRAQINNDRTTILHEAATVRSIVAHHEKLLTNRSVSALLRRTSGVKESVVTVSGTGQVLKVLAPLTALRDRIDGHTLAAGKDISGTTGAQAFAAVPFLKLDTTVLGGSGSITLALLFARPISGSDASIYYFLLGGGIALLVAVAVIWVISRRISRRVVAASVAARQIAAGTSTPESSGTSAPTPSSPAWTMPSTRWPRTSPGRATKSASSCCRSPMTCAPR